MMRQLIAASYHFLVELILAILILFLVYYIPVEQFPPLFWIFSSSFCAFFFLLLFLIKFEGKESWLYFIIIFPLLLFLGSFTSMPLIQIAILGLLIFWRGISFFKRQTKGINNVFIFLFLVTGISLTFFSGSSEYKDQNIIIILFFTEIMLVLLGLFISKWATIDENRGKFMIYFGGFLIGAAVAGVVITYGFKLIKLLISGILILVAYILAYSLRIGYAIIHYLGNLFGMKTHEIVATEALEVEWYDYPSRIIKQLHNKPTWLGFLLIAALLIGAYYYYKKRKKVVFSKKGDASMLQISEEVSVNKGGFFFKKRAKPPKDQVRSEIFFLERFASKLKMGRRPFESLTEWWARIGISASGDLSKIYENVRYGEEPSSADEVSKVRVEIIQIKEQFKEKA